MDVNRIIIYCCLAAMLVFGLLSVMKRSIIKNALCLALVSACLSLIMYDFGAVHAAVFELSVCSGLITVIFISGISLSNAAKDSAQKEIEDSRRMRALPVVLIAAGAVFMVAAVAVKFSIPVSERLNLDFSQVFWNERNIDIWGQIIVMLTGGTAITVLFKEAVKRK